MGSLPVRGALALLLSLGVGCGGGDGGGPPAPDAGPPPVDGGPPSNLPEIVIGDLDTSLRMSDLTDPLRDQLCGGVGMFHASLHRELHDYWCIRDASDLRPTPSIPDPEFTCNRLLDPCLMIGAFGGGASIYLDSETMDCQREVDRWQRVEACTDPTVEEFLACLRDNVELELAVRDRASLTCAEALAMQTVQPEGIMNCYCGTRARTGRPPAGDADWDYLPDDVDECPDSAAEYYRVSEVGCTAFQDRDGDDRWDEEDLCPGTEPDAAEVSAQGCSRAQDDDFDDVPNLADPCPGTADGAELVTPGCSLEQDTDADGVPNAADLCPLTPAGSTELVHGCAPTQGEPWTMGIVDTLPPGLDTLTLGAGQPDPVVFHIVPGAATPAAGGTDYVGTLYMDLPGGQYLTLPESNVHFQDGTVPGQPATILGEIVAPIPTLGLFQGVQVDAGRCEVGFGPGSAMEIVDLEAPTVPGRSYLFVRCMVGFSGSVGGMEWRLPGGREMLLVLEPSDPSIFVHGDVSGVGLLGRVSDAGVGFSAQGRFPYAPIQTWGLAPEDTAGFEGHVYVNGTVPVKTMLPEQFVKVAVDGEMVIDLDPQNDGLPELGGLLDADLRFAANGTVEQTFSFFGVLPIEVTAGEASFGGTFGPDGRTLWFTGSAGPNEIRFPGIFPIEQPSVVRAAGRISDVEGAESYLHAEGAFSFLGSEIDLPAFIPGLLDFNVTGSVDIDDVGIVVEGMTSGSLHPWLSVSGGVRIYFELSWDLRTFRVELDGNMSFQGRTIDRVYLGDDDIEFGS